MILVAATYLTQLIIYQYNYIYFQKGLGCHTMAIISIQLSLACQGTLRLYWFKEMDVALLLFFQKNIVVVLYGGL